MNVAKSGLKAWLGALGITLTLMSSPLSSEEYAASFKNTDINEFIQVVGRNLEKTIIIDPNVRGKIDVRSYDVMNEEQYYQFFLNVLEVYGFAVVEMESGVLKVIRDKDAKTSSLPVLDRDTRGSGDTMVTRVVPVENVSVRELAPLLRQLNDQSGGGMVVSYDPSNVIMMTGRSETVQRLVEIIERVDQAGDQDVDMVSLEYASASEIVRIAQSLYEKNNEGVPALLIPKIVADERSNSVIVSGEPRARSRVVKLIKQLDQDLKTEGNTRVFYLKYAKAPEVVEVLKNVSSSIQAEVEQQTSTGNNSQRRRSSGNETVSISPHEPTNSVVITAQKDMLASLEKVIRELDIRRAQVQVEAIIVEIMEGDSVDFGVQWISEDGGMVQYNNGNQVPIGSLAAGAYQARERPGTTTTRITDGGVEVTTTEPDEPGDISLLANLLGSVNGMMFGTIQNDWAAVVQAVTQDTRSNILATPSIVTVDNEEASFLVGQEVPTISGSTTGDNNDNPFQTVDRTEIGIKLKVTPQINEGDAVQMTIEQEVSSLSGATAVDVIINKRELKTTVMADDGETIVLGGLIDEDVQESVSKVPLLGDIPILGKLFSSTSTSKQKRNLMVFIRPTIVRDGNRMRDLSSAKYNYIRALQLDERSRGISLMPTEETPLLNDWDNKLTLPPGFDEYLEKKGKESSDDKNNESTND
ncbi:MULTISPECIES: type II secretion system secretin GspD [Idiomarina]|mgnify:FL=1|jgi:general secretion pathway protein D|uniref:type II secretion system secretin GspD n=2 Tax=Idiomarinaceae TaxID=267893 RepID=UPI0006C84F83|nr:MULTISPECIES: type II secretion system secretin GspD [Idiomarina]RDX34884.1 type II secretion system protein GspD [Idiomarina sp. HD9-110m-PIT-SAG05]KPD21708.1 general secretion pathway protein GspD [Idiomarina abyssalis]MAL83947.1 type II secretion system protein GspD [Idiomarina sp.]MAO66917.1 type II secretion system protein GspD [Idiomarina sp.]MBE92301.1 type II secretion system protein GspD [Idiomarina sp.]|tara:strand:- start:112 stop:2202 length:2091 start_codon:yes stop_codon:yes gene_type:complete